jgi:hypothetical protein
MLERSFVCRRPAQPPALHGQQPAPLKPLVPYPS